ncbi:Oidioi.mRNA.OKI2018_I69.PAR.g10196.t1.cds [Oikopleura dioica]|uniref:Oidioi.mRNA.OKI2018_I69.PAR.g10196.t1.cds n=1 Tax=Oikopleura dioica TaxID=34765 RepID=A0ABN7RV59_OIKDI|nr:Oidioi.mRNA.OKI2018_I69.PAR.g10196.t1.cds [Oikopleura dioica]
MALKFPTLVYIDEENAEITWSRQLRGDLDGDGKVDLNEYLEPEVIPEDGKHVHSDNIPDKTSMILHDALRTDAGRYQLEVKTETGVDKIHFLVRVIDVPGPPTQPRISELVGESCRVDWGPPLEDGGCLIRGYLIERKKTCSTRWIRLNSSLHEFHNFFADRMMEGSEYEIRVSAVNECGVGEPSMNSEKFIPMEPTSEVLDFCSSDVTDGTVKLNWMEPLDIGYAGLDGYELQHQVLKGKKHDDDALSATEWVDSNNQKLLAPEAMDFICKNLEIGKYYAFRIRTRNIAGSSKWVYCGPIICAFAVIDPKLLIPKEYKNPGIFVRKGARLNVLIPFEGRPLPQISWKMLEPPKEGWEFLEASMKPLEDYVTIKNNQTSSQLTIKETRMSDTGKYFIKLSVGDVEVESEINVNVVDIPGEVKELKIVEIVGTTAELSWKPPLSSGNLDILGYRVEKRDKRSGADCPWFMCLEKTRQEKCFIHGLVPNNDYAFRVTAINEIGQGPPSSTDYGRVDATPYDLKLKPYISKSLEKAPKFTTPLNSRSMIVNFETTLSCSFEAYPPPKITWLWNKVPIDKMNPHFMMISQGGICQLKLRRVRFGDGGIYSCVAENELGTGKF